MGSTSSNKGEIPSCYKGLGWIFTNLDLSSNEGESGEENIQKSCYNQNIEEFISEKLADPQNVYSGLIENRFREFINSMKESDPTIIIIYRIRIRI